MNYLYQNKLIHFFFKFIYIMNNVIVDAFFKSESSGRLDFFN